MRSQGSGRRGTVFLTLTLLLVGCVSVQTRRQPLPAGDPASGGVAVTVYADDDARREGHPGPRFVNGELERRVDGAWQPIFRSLDPVWTVLDLPPGRYRVRFPAVLDPSGHVVPLEEDGKVFRVRAGEVTEVDATLRHVSTALIVAGVVTAVVAAVLLEEWLDDHDLPRPPLPKLHPIVADTVFHLTIELGHSDWGIPPDADLGPVVTSHFPAEGDVVALDLERIVFVASEPLEPSEVPADAISVWSEETGLVPGATRYEADRWWLVWEAEHPLPRPGRYRVTLVEDEIEDLAGHEISYPVSFSFETR